MVSNRFHVVVPKLIFEQRVEHGIICTLLDRGAKQKKTIVMLFKPKMVRVVQNLRLIGFF